MKIGWVSFALTGSVTIALLVPGVSVSQETGGTKRPAGPIRRLPDGKPDLTGYWNARGRVGMYSVEKTEARKEQAIPAGPGLIIDPKDGRIPYQPWAREKEIDLSTNHMVEESDAHCYPSGFPHLSYAQFGYQIMQPAGYIIFIWEQMHAFRVIPLDGRPHLDPKIHLFMGDSRGRWEGDTLVVDVTNQVARTWFDIAANFHSDQIHVVERFTPIDENTINYEATIDDPKVYTRPWKIGFLVDRNPVANYELMEYPCWEGERDLPQYTEDQGGTKKEKLK
jgi:hypothetical protein